MTRTITLIAGEASGDLLGSRLMKALKAQYAGSLHFHGVGGPRMQAEGLESLFPMEELSLMGFLEIIPHIPLLKKRMQQTIDDICAIKPDIVITIDSPGFNFRIAKQLTELSIPLVHYVAPTVWAYKAKRAQKVADLYDHILLLLPFEEDYFNLPGLTPHFVGHPITEEPIRSGNKDRFVQRHNLSPDQRFICMLAGSRSTEISRLLPIFRQSIALLKQKIGDFTLLCPTLPHLRTMMERATADFAVPVICIDDTQDKYDAYAASDVALAKSGTGTLELAIAQLPMVITYRLNPISHFLIKRLVRIKYANLLNLIIDQEAIPELLQDQCTPKHIAETLYQLLENQTKRDRQLALSKKALAKLGLKDTRSPSEKAAFIVLNQVKPLNSTN